MKRKSKARFVATMTARVNGDLPHNIAYLWNQDGGEGRAIICQPLFNQTEGNIVKPECITLRMAVCNQKAAKEIQAVLERISEQSESRRAIRKKGV